MSNGVSLMITVTLEYSPHIAAGVCCPILYLDYFIIIFLSTIIVNTVVYRFLYKLLHILNCMFLILLFLMDYIYLIISLKYCQFAIILKGAKVEL